MTYSVTDSRVYPEHGAVGHRSWGPVVECVSRVSFPHPAPGSRSERGYVLASLQLIDSTTAIAWQALCEHLEKWFHRPDTQALSIVLTAAYAHAFAGDPIWLFVIGPAASGKTSICCNSASAFPLTTIMGDITPKAFLPSMGGASLLGRIGKSGILIFKDFTTILSKRPEDQQEVAASLREVFDGAFSRDTGRGKVGWEGKITVIAATTPAIESAWSIHRELGERFMQVRWPNSNPVAVSRAARRQQGNEKLIADTMRTLTRAFLESAPQEDPPGLDPFQADSIDNLAALVAAIRPQCKREHGGREIIGVSTPEEPARIGKALAAVARYRAAMFRSPVVRASDIAASIRVGLDSVPYGRSAILSAIPPDVAIGSTEVVKQTKLLATTVRWHAEELEALRAIEITGSGRGAENTFRMQPDFAEMWVTAHNPMPTDGLSS